MSQPEGTAGVDFQALEAKRRAARRRSRWALYLGIPGTLLIALWSVGEVTGDSTAGVFAAFLLPFFAGAATVWLNRWPVRRFRRLAKREVLARLAADRGLTYRLEGPRGGRGALKPFKDLRLVPRHDRAAFEDALEGEIQGVRCAVFEAHLEEQYRDSDGDRHWRSVFRGLFCHFTFPKRLSARTFIETEEPIANFFGNLLSSDRKVILESPEFEKIFDVYSNDQVEARYILTPTFMQRMVDLYDLLGRPKLRAALDETGLFLRLPRASSFELKDISQPVDQGGMIQVFERELDLISDIIESLNLATSTRV